MSLQQCIWPVQTGARAIHLSRHSWNLDPENAINPLLGAAWPIVYFLQGRLGMAASFTRTYRFVCLAIVAKHLWCEQPVKEIQLTSICYVQICVYSSSYGDFLRWIDRRPAAFADSTRSDCDIFVRITMLLSFTPVRWIDTANFINVEVRVC